MQSAHVKIFGGNLKKMYSKDSFKFYKKNPLYSFKV